MYNLVERVGWNENWDIGKQIWMGGREISSEAGLANLVIKCGCQIRLIECNAKAAAVEALRPVIGPVSGRWIDVSLLCD